MNWTELSHRMERSVIKKDSTATDNQYFMATHVPFQDLEVIESGDMTSEPAHLSEEEIYRKYILNRANRHQMIIVRGQAGTGKSHLICWLYNRLVNDVENYNPEKEKVIFLRRLGNTSRGAVQQMLDAGMVQDKELQEKFQKFVNAGESQSEEEFKQTIYNAFVAKVQTDRSNAFYRPIKCKDIASFLRDMRVQDYFMSENGPISRCYRMITAGADSGVTADAIFVAEDFNFPRDVARQIKSEAATEARDFYLDELRNDEEAMSKLAAYLNRFTSSVIQSCANITSENARDLFVNLRKQLLKEGKNLTILIEDFTSFSIVDSELITALAVENGGGYSDLCRVTSIIGITDSYYKSFRDNFTDRVSEQINVIEQSFSDESFLLEIAARYLNAVYCDPDLLSLWYQQGAQSQQLPVADFKPDYAWDSVLVDGKEMTLYPFTKHSLVTMFQKLKEKSPRHYLDYAIKQMFRQFAMDMVDHTERSFPTIPSYIAAPSMNITYASSVEESALPEEDKQRLKTLLATWGDGTSASSNGCIGGIPNEFLVEIGLGAFSGLSEAQKEAKPIPAGNQESQEPQGTAADKPTTVQKSKAEIDYERFCEDIQAWFENGKRPNYDSDYFKWVGDFVVQAIPWQDEGIPASFVAQRKSGHFVMMEGSEKSIDPESVPVYLPRTSEVRNVLYGLATFNFHKSWTFPDAEYYQYVLITWLEKNKSTIKKRIYGPVTIQQEQPLVTWCLALEYLERCLLGEKLDGKDPYKTLKILLGSHPADIHAKRTNKSWEQVVTGIRNASASYMQANQLLLSGANSYMGVIGDSAANTAKIYRYNELLNSLSHLEQKGWDVSDELDAYKDCKLYSNTIKTLSDLYRRIQIVAQEEQRSAKQAALELSEVVGETPTKDVLMDLINEIKRFYAQCKQSNQVYRSDLEMKFSEEPGVWAQELMMLFEMARDAEKIKNPIEVITRFADDPMATFNERISSLQAVADFADRVKQHFQQLAGGSQAAVDTDTAEEAMNTLDQVLEITEHLEVRA